MYKKNLFVIDPKIKLKSSTPADIVSNYMQQYIIVKTYYKRRYLTQYEHFIYHLARDFVIWVQTYYGEDL